MNQTKARAGVSGAGEVAAGGFDAPIVPRGTGDGASSEAALSESASQPMPPLTADEYAALRGDIAERGIVVPVVVDQRGRLLDHGHHRLRIATEMGVHCPTVVREVADDDEAWDVAVTLNATRRHLSREQRSELIRAELVRRPGDSDRAIARRVGCDQKTVGGVRRDGELPHSGDGVSKWTSSWWRPSARTRRFAQALEAGRRGAPRPQAPDVQAGRRRAGRGRVRPAHPGHGRERVAGMSARHLREEVFVADNLVLGERVAYVLPVIPEDAPYPVREGIARRRIAATTGECPCGAIVDYGQPVAGEVGVGEVAHGGRCPTSTTKLVKAVRRWRR